MKRNVTGCLGSIAGGIAIGVFGFMTFLASIHNPASYKTLFITLALPFVVMSARFENWPDWTAWATFGASVALWSAIIHLVRRRLQ